METQSQTHQLAAIMFTDIVGYTALMGENQKKALELVEQNKSIQKSLIEKFGGRWHKDLGDGTLISFGSAVDAVKAAAEIQSRTGEIPHLVLRIGIHLGDVTYKYNDVFGDGVNIASRIESIADPGGIYITESVQKAIRGRIDLNISFLGEYNLKNVDYAVKVFALQGDGLPEPGEKYDTVTRETFFEKFKKRNIHRVTISYGLIAFIVFNILTYLIHGSELVLIELLLVGYVIAVWLTWNFEFSPQGMVDTRSRQSVMNPYSSGQKKPLTDNLTIGILILLTVVTYFLKSNTAFMNKGNFEEGVAVMYIENLTEDENFGDQLVHLIHTNLSQDTSLNLVSRQRIYDAMKEVSGTSKNPDRSVATEVAQMLGIGNILIGQALQQKDNAVVQMELMDVTSGKILNTEKVEGEMQGIFQLADRISSAIMADARPESNFEVTQITTANTEAYQAFYDGLEFYWNWERSLAREKFEEAIELDSTFALAYLFRAFSRPNVRSDYYQDIAPELRDILKAKELSNWLPQREKLLMEATLASHEGRFEEAQKYFIQLFIIDPDHRMAMGELLKNVTRYDLPESIDLGKVFLNRNRYYGFETNQLAYIHAQYGYKELAQQYIQHYIKLEPNNWNVYQSGWEINLILGEKERASHFLDTLSMLSPKDQALGAVIWKTYHFFVTGQPDKALALNSEFSDSLNYWWGYDMFEPLSNMLKGKFSKATTQLEKITSRDVEDSQRVKNIINLERGILLTSARKYDQAEKLFKEVIEISDRPSYRSYNPFTFLAYYRLALMEANRGNMAKVMDIKLELQNRIEAGEVDWRFRHFPVLLQCEIHLVAGDYDSVGELLSTFERRVRDSSPHYLSLLYGLHWKKKNYSGALELLDPFYKHFFRSRIAYGGSRTMYAHILAFLEYTRGRIYEDAGNIKEAIAHYEQFLENFNDSDPGIFEKEDATKRLKNLKSTANVD